MENNNSDKKDNELINALKQTQGEEWNDQKDKRADIKKDNQMGCVWAAVITIILVIFFVIWFVDKFKWVA
jgi:hypothetical protein